MASDPVVGDLRWRVTLGTRKAQESGTWDIQENTTDQVQVFANVVPLGTQLYLEGKQISDDEVTHRITIRWRQLPSIYDTITRTTSYGGKTQREIFRVLRSTEWAGRKRYLIIEARLEKVLDA